MSTLRSIRLLNSVEAGLTTGAEFNVFLQDSGRLSEFHVLLSMRGQTRRMAASSVTMEAIIDSSIATNAVFADTDINNTTAALAITKNQTAMSSISNDSPTLNVIGTNPVSWSLFKASQWYEENVKNVIANLADLNTSTYSTKEELITTPSSVSIIVGFPRAMAAVVASLPTSTAMAQDATIMSIVVADSSAITIVSESVSVMPIIAASQDAMNEITTSSVAMPIMANSANAMVAISKVSAAFNSFLGSSSFSSNIKNAICNIAGLNPSSFATVDDIISNADALTSVASNGAASKALASSSSAVTTLASSSNLSIILGSTVAMEFFGTEGNLQAFLAVPAAVPVVFGSSVAKGVIVASTPLMNLIATTPAIVSFLSGISTTSIPSNLNVVGANNAFGGLPEKFILLSIRANNIGAIAMTFTLAGSPLAGTTYGNVVSASGTVTATSVFGISNPATWKASGIAATAAASPSATYVDMT